MDENYYFLDYWHIILRESITQEYWDKSIEENKVLSGLLARQNFYSMKLEHSVLFYGEMMYELLMLPDEGWRTIRKNIRKYARRVSELRKFENDEYHHDLNQPIVNHSLVLGSNIETWGMITYKSSVREIPGTADKAVYFTNLFGALYEKGELDPCPGVLSLILEFLMKVSLEYNCFSNLSHNEIDPRTDYLMYYKNRYVLEHIDEGIIDWVVTERGIDEMHQNFLILLKGLFPTALGKKFDTICEIILDDCEIDENDLSTGDLIAIFDIIILEFWGLQTEEKQLEYINSWCVPIYLYELIRVMIPILNFDVFDVFIKTMEQFGSHVMNEDFIERNMKLISKTYDRRKSTIKRWYNDIENTMGLDYVRLVYIIGYNLYLGDLSTLELMTSFIGKILPVSGNSSELLTAFLAHYYYYKKDFNNALSYFNQLSKEALHTEIMIALCECCDEERIPFLETFEKLIHSHSENIPYRKHSIRDLFFSLIGEKGIKFLHPLLEDLLNRENLETSNLIGDFGDISADLGFVEDARIMLTKGLDLSSDDVHKAKFLNSLGTLDVQEAKFDDAIEKISSALDLDKNAQFYLNMANTLTLMGKTLEAQDFATRANNTTKKNQYASFAEIMCMNIETGGLSFLTHILINYSGLEDPDIIKHCRVANKLFREIFPQHEEIQDLASSIFFHYANAVEILFHNKLGLLFQNKMNKIYKTKKEAQIQANSRIKNLAYDNHVILNQWPKILKEIKKPTGGSFKKYKSCMNPLSGSDIQELIKISEFTAPYRNKSDHGEIFAFDTVRALHGQIVYSLNKLILIFEKFL